LVRPIFNASGGEAGGMPSAEPEALANAMIDCIRAGASILNLSISLADASRNANDALAQALKLCRERGRVSRSGRRQ
jgi:hypothetical protein